MLRNMTPGQIEAEINSADNRYYTAQNLGLDREPTQDELTRLDAGRALYWLATMVADTLVLGGELRLSTYYGFQPLHGDTFQIMTANRTRDGEFDGLPEGGYVGCMDQNVCLRISYRGGDGNDVVLSAENTDPATALLIGLLVPAIQQVITTPTVEQTREHILLARQVGVPVVEETESKLPAPTTPISAPPPPTK